MSKSKKEPHGQIKGLKLDRSTIDGGTVNPDMSRTF